MLKELYSHMLESKANGRLWVGTVVSSRTRKLKGLKDGHCSQLVFLDSAVRQALKSVFFHGQMAPPVWSWAIHL